MWADAQRDGRPAEYRWHPLRKFGNSILVPRRKVWLTPAAFECRAVTLPIYENARLGSKVNFAPDKILSGGKSPRKCIYNVAAQKTAKHPEKFGWPAVSDVAAVTKARRETR